MDNLRFSNKQLRSLIVPLLMEQLLVMLVGLADTFVVSFCGEAAVSGVSLVNAFNTIFIYLFTALASGGAVVVSQYLGRAEEDMASESASQLLMISTLFSCVMMVFVLVLRSALLTGLFGCVEPAVMQASLTYLRISAYSYPALAVYNAGAALYRSMGKTNVTMYISVASNIINLVGNILGVFVFRAGVAGVAWPSFLARFFSAVVMTILCFRKENDVYYTWKRVFCWSGQRLRTILSIAVPNGVESGVFQLVKVALSSVVALFGTYQIAANGIAQSFWSMAALIGVAMGPVFITVIGQCMGAGEITQAEYYFKRLLRITVLLAIVWNLIVFALTPLIISVYDITPQTKRLVVQLVLLHNIFNAVAFPFADPLGRGLRAAGDVRYTMGVSIFTTVGVRLVFSVILAMWMQKGVIGIALAMVLDWTVRGIVLYIRFRKGKWKNYSVI